MYKCKEHGIVESQYCPECGEYSRCDCSVQTTTRVKDLTYDCDDGEMTVTIYIEHCETCGMVSDVHR